MHINLHVKIHHLELFSSSILAAPSEITLKKKTLLVAI